MANFHVFHFFPLYLINFVVKKYFLLLEWVIGVYIHYLAKFQVFWMALNSDRANFQ